MNIRLKNLNTHKEAILYKLKHATTRQHVDDLYKKLHIVECEIFSEQLKLGKSTEVITNQRNLNVLDDRFDKRMTPTYLKNMPKVEDRDDSIDAYTRGVEAMVKLIKKEIDERYNSFMANLIAKEFSEDERLRRNID